MEQSRPLTHAWTADNRVDVDPDSALHLTLTMDASRNFSSTALVGDTQDTPLYRLDSPVKQESLVKLEPTFEDAAWRICEHQRLPSEDGLWQGEAEDPGTQVKREVIEARSFKYDAATSTHFQEHCRVLDFGASTSRSCPKPEIQPQPPPRTEPSRGPLSNHALQDYQLQLMLLEQQKRKRDALCPRPPAEPAGDPPSNFALQDYQLQLMLVEQQNRKRNALCPPPTEEAASDRPSDHGLRDYQMQREILEQQNKKRKSVALRSERPDSVNFAPQQLLGDLSQDYQTQLLLLTKQNEKRLMLEKEAKEKEKMDYQAQLLLLTEQNKKRLMMAREAGEKAKTSGTNTKTDTLPGPTS
jgi:hypothetical protein